MTLREILERKGNSVHTTEPTATLLEAAQLMMRYRIGSLVVLEGEKLVGIFTERDLLRVAATGRDLKDVCVQEAMTVDVITGKPDDSVTSVMKLLTEKRIRHLPVLDGDRLMGMISIGDVVKAQYENLEFENHMLKSYISS
ncbi:MAG: inosine-5-monophosphate dehydrogenase [Pirellulaceae bacterium]|nr:MAG: inosine-5-monophosphate dehydrogenase [Pirellulaceae bacterium]